MPLNVPCKVGRLEVTDTGVVRTTKLFGGAIVWQVPVGAITALSAKPGSIGTVNITFQTTQGVFTADTVTRPNFEKLQYVMHVGGTISPADPKPEKPKKPRHWYEDESLRAHVETYDDAKKMAKDVEALSRYGWIPQNQVAQGGQVSGRKMIGGAIVGGILTGGIGAPLGALAGAGRSKSQITVTYVRAPEWFAKQGS